MITVYYDGNCGACSKEISHYQKIAPQGIFTWIDINQDIEKIEEEGVTLSEALKILHTKDQNGKLYKGVDSFILIWKQLKRWRILAFLVRLPVIYQIVNIAYGIFARRRFKKLAHCQRAEKNEKSL